MEPIIQFSGADILGGDSVVIYGLDMAINPGDFVYIVGKVGSGKTSIIRTMTAETGSPREKDPSVGSTSATSVQKTYRCCAGAWASCSRISNC